MQANEVKAIFDQQAATYDTQWSKLAPLRDALHLLAGTVVSGLPSKARILCVGAGTGSEILYLAQRFPEWHFTAVEPSGPMLEVCRRRVEEHGIITRCVFHEGYLDSLPPSDTFNAATSFLVSQFMMDRDERRNFFGSIAQRLELGGYLLNADLASDIHSPAYQQLLEVWFRMMRAADVGPEMLDRLRTAYRQDVAVLPIAQVEAIIASAGFEQPVLFFQGGLIHAWYSRREK